MKILTELEVKNNVNTYEGMSIKRQQELRMQNCYLIIDIASGFNDHVKKTVVSGAMVIINHFFISKSYLEYNRLLM